MSMQGEGCNRALRILLEICFMRVANPHLGPFVATLSYRDICHFKLGCRELQPERGLKWAEATATCSES